jgi:hypothetical protein
MTGHDKIRIYSCIQDPKTVKIVSEFRRCVLQMYLIWRSVRDAIPPRLVPLGCYFMRLVNSNVRLGDVVRLGLRPEELGHPRYLKVVEACEALERLRQRLVVLRSEIVCHIQQEIGKSSLTVETPLILGIHVRKDNDTFFFRWKR